MKKRKFSLLLNIATICLCVCAIAIGVYSAKTASLSISGSIGFNAHNIDYSATVTMYGHSGTDGKPVAETSADSLTETSGTCAIPSGTTFSDLGTSGNPETIYIKVEVTNKSDYPIAVKVDLASCTSGDSSLTIGASQDTSAVILADKTVSDDTKTGSVTFELNLQPNAAGDYDNIDPATAVNLKVDLAKTDLTAGTAVRADIPAEIQTFSTDDVTAFKNFVNDKGIEPNMNIQLKFTTQQCYAEAFPYYIEMGQVKDSTEKLKWLVVGTMETSGLVELTAEDKTALSEGLMLNKTYSLLSEKTLTADLTNANATSSFGYGLPFHNQYNISTSKCTKVGYTDVNADNYVISNIRQYLKGETVKDNYSRSGYELSASGDDVNMFDNYNLANDPVYAKIQARTLESLYNEAEDSSKDLGGMQSSDIPSKLPSQANSVDKTENADKFWLLSYTEYHTLFDKTENYLNDGYNYNLTSLNIPTLKSGTATYTSGWRLRSPASSAAVAYYVNNFGGLGNIDVGDYYYSGARVAFQI